MKEIVRLRPETIAGFACTWVPPGSLAVVAAYSKSTHGLLHGRASAPATRPSERESCGNAVLANVSYRATDGLRGSGGSWPGCGSFTNFRYRPFSDTAIARCLPFKSRRADIESSHRWSVATELVQRLLRAEAAALQAADCNSESARRSAAGGSADNSSCSLKVRLLQPHITQTLRKRVR